MLWYKLQTSRILCATVLPESMYREFQTTILDRQQ